MKIIQGVPFLLLIGALLFLSPGVWANPQSTTNQVIISPELPYPHPFYDAMELVTLLTNKKDNWIAKSFAILGKYCSTKEFTTNISKGRWKEALNDFQRSNAPHKKFPSYLASYLNLLSEPLDTKDLTTSKIQITTANQQSPKEIQAESSILASTSVVLDALGKVVAKRFKEELTIGFLNKFRDKINRGDELGKCLLALFPSVYNIIQNIEPYNFKIYLSSLKEAFQNDTNNFKNQIPNCFRILMPKDDKTRITFICLDFFLETLKNRSFLQKVKKVAESEDLRSLDQREYFLIQTPIVLINNLIDKSLEKLITVEELNKAIANDQNNIFPNLFIGLIIIKEEAYREAIYNSFNKMHLSDINLKHYYNLINTTCKAIEDITKDKHNGERITYEEAKLYILTIRKLINDSFYAICPMTPSSKLINDINRLSETTLYILSAWQNIEKKNYGLLLSNLLKIVNDILGKGCSEESGNIQCQLVKYLTLAVSIAQTKEAEEIEKIIEAAILPVGSYRIKRTNRSSISLNAYVGGFFGGETLTNSGKGKIHNLAGNIGFAAPIGISFNKGLKKKHSKDTYNKSHSLFISIIDIGAIVNWRIQHEQSGGMPEIKWKNVFAPGLFAIRGLKNSPISIGVGLQYGPQLRKIKIPSDTSSNGSTTPAEAVIESSTLRFGLIVTVDIPLLHFTPKN